MTGSLTIGQCATLACLLEATAPKVGNVHRGADFADLTFTDFAISSVGIAPAMEVAEKTGVGRAVYDAVAATRRLVSTNTNLGMALLLAPLAAVPRKRKLSPSAVEDVIYNLTAEDTSLVYDAIRLANPGGLGKVEAMDVSDAAPANLLVAMRAAADRDLVARQYADNFSIVLNEALPALLSSINRGWSLTDSIVHAHLSLIAAHGDTLITRKCGRIVALQAAKLAAQVLAAGQPGDENYFAAAADFDFWLRSDGNRRNPGSTADLIAAALFAALRDGLVPFPIR